MAANPHEGRKPNGWFAEGNTPSNGFEPGNVPANRFQKGATPNPGGRPKGLARYVRDLVGNDGRRIADYMLNILNDRKATTADRMKAAMWLADRGFGKAVDVTPQNEGDDPLGLNDARARLVRKLAALPAPDDSPGESPGEAEPPTPG